MNSNPMAPGGPFAPYRPVAAQAGGAGLQRQDYPSQGGSGVMSNATPQSYYAQQQLPQTQRGASDFELGYGLGLQHQQQSPSASLLQQQQQRAIYASAPSRQAGLPMATPASQFVTYQTPGGGAGYATPAGPFQQVGMPYSVTHAYATYTAVPTGYLTANAGMAQAAASQSQLDNAQRQMQRALALQAQAQAQLVGDPNQMYWGVRNQPGTAPAMGSAQSAVDQFMQMNAAMRTAAYLPPKTHGQKRSHPDSHQQQHQVKVEKEAGLMTGHVQAAARNLSTPVLGNQDRQRLAMAVHSVERVEQRESDTPVITVQLPGAQSAQTATAPTTPGVSGSPHLPTLKEALSKPNPTTSLNPLRKTPSPNPSHAGPMPMEPHFELLENTHRCSGSLGGDLFLRPHSSDLRVGSGEHIPAMRTDSASTGSATLCASERNVYATGQEPKTSGSIDYKHEHPIPLVDDPRFVLRGNDPVLPVARGQSSLNDSSLGSLVRWPSALGPTSPGRNTSDGSAKPATDAKPVSGGLDLLADTARRSSSDAIPGGFESIGPFWGPGGRSVTEIPSGNSPTGPAQSFGSFSSSSQGFVGFPEYPPALPTYNINGNSGPRNIPMPLGFPAPPLPIPGYGMQQQPPMAYQGTGGRVQSFGSAQSFGSGSSAGYPQGPAMSMAPVVSPFPAVSAPYPPTTMAAPPSAPPSPQSMVAEVPPTVTETARDSPYHPSAKRTRGRPKTSHLQTPQAKQLKLARRRKSNREAARRCRAKKKRLAMIAAGLLPADAPEEPVARSPEPNEDFDEMDDEEDDEDFE